MSQMISQIISALGPRGAQSDERPALTISQIMISQMISQIISSLGPRGAKSDDSTAVWAPGDHKRRQYSTGRRHVCLGGGEAEIPTPTQEGVRADALLAPSGKWISQIKISQIIC